jgi:hypothetical protein
MSRFTKWYWYKETMNQIVFNLFCEDSDRRYWMVTEDRLVQLQQMEKDYKLVKAEADLYRTMYQTQQQKLNEVMVWAQENLRGVLNEK